MLPCRRTEHNLEDPAIFDDLIETGLLDVTGALTIGQVLNAKLTGTYDSLTPLTAEKVEDINIKGAKKDIPGGYIMAYEPPAPESKPSSGSGIDVEYEGGNSFSTSKSAVPTSVEIDGVEVPFTGDGKFFTVGCISADAKWVTVRWNSTSVTVNFKPDVNVVCAEVAIPKTGDMPIFAAVAAFFGF